MKAQHEYAIYIEINLEFGETPRVYEAKTFREPYECAGWRKKEPEVVA
jgi:hypothetical protein